MITDEKLNEYLQDFAGFISENYDVYEGDFYDENGDVITASQLCWKYLEGIERQ